MTVSQRARDSLDRMMIEGLRQSMAQQQPQAQIRTVPEVAQGSLTHMAVLSIASYSFRIIAALHFVHDARTREWIAGVTGQDEGELGPQQFIDAICEIGNMCCGAMNRELGAFHDCLGLSTPQILDIRSLPHMAQIGTDHLQHFEIDMLPGLPLYATMCARAYTPLDFHWRAPEVQEIAGELEFF
ncbi:hypothetical protein PMI14_00691 [Acidovorax sp. CF316]|uniref:hypothetical protein n=1 Tax=Acidovorax sp. CF316 TaxID=1144317 RepID=UPI00026BBE69|nr:hypothetical protein [Acidovorax sp. CF316]EJE54395.1 hypothetical protein PMI14_00691 [Acidovorax sp. CF316]